MTGDILNHLHDIYTVECSTPTKIKILRVFNDMGKCYIILSEKGRIQNCIFSLLSYLYLIYAWENARRKHTKMLVISG